MFFSKSTKAPTHVAIIPDGNRRWALAQKFPTKEGHKKGADRVFEITLHAHDLGVKVITFYIFSKENWNRSLMEREFLFSLLEERLHFHEPEMLKKGVVFRHVGDKKGLPSHLEKCLDALEEKTSHNLGIQLQLAINYGGRQEIMEAVKYFQAHPDKSLDEDSFSEVLSTKGCPDPELIIRTSGERRASNFLLWQGHYAEWVYEDRAWPDFEPCHFKEAIEEYNRRIRRWGGG